MQEGGDVTFKATENPPVVMPARASRTGATHAHVTWLKPLEGTARLLTTLVVRDNVDIRDPSDFLVAELGLQGLNTAHVFGSSILFEVKPPTGEPDAGNPLVRFGGGRGRTQSVPPTPILWGTTIESDHAEQSPARSRMAAWATGPGQDQTRKKRA